MIVFTLKTLTAILIFLFGEPHNVMYTALTFTCLSLLLDFFRKYEPPKKKKVILEEFVKRTLAYMAFLIIANRIDHLGLGELLGWDGSTQFLVCLYILSREIRVILDYIREQGIAVPHILDDRVRTMEGQPGQQDGVGNDESFGASSIPSEPSTPSTDIDAKIYSIKQQLAAIEESTKKN